MGFGAQLKGLFAVNYAEDIFSGQFYEFGGFGYAGFFDEVFVGSCG